MKLATSFFNRIRSVARVSLFTPRNSVVVIDSYRSSLFRGFTIANEPIREFSVCYLRGERIYLDCVLFVILRRVLGLGMRGDYMYSFLVLSRAQYALSYIDDSASLYLVASSLPNIRFFVFQNGIRDLLELEVMRNVLYEATYLNCSNVTINTHGVVASCDYRVVFGEYGADIREFGSLASTAIANGSGTKSSSSKVIFISQYRSFKTVYSETDYPISFDDFYESERKVLPLVETYLNRYELTMDVLLSNSWQKGVENHERLFYGDLLGPETSYVKSGLDKSELQDYELVITIDSTLGFELAAIGKKVLFVDLRMKSMTEIRKARSLERMFARSNADQFWSYVVTEYFELEQKINNIIDVDADRYLEIWNDECSAFLNSSIEVGGDDQYPSTLSANSF